MVKQMKYEDVFEAISHPLRIDILKKLANRPMSFSELKRELNIKSSGKLDFHLKRLEGLITVNEDNRYCLTNDGYAALQVIDSLVKYGWQKRAFYLNIVVWAFVNTFAALTNLTLWLYLILPLSSAWLAFYTYWSIKKRRVLSM